MSQLPAVTAAYVSLAAVSLRFLSSGDGSSPRRRTFPPMDASSPLGWRTGLWPPSASCSLSVGSRLLFFAFPLPLFSRIILLLICHSTYNKLRDERRRDGLASARLANSKVMR